MNGAPSLKRESEIERYQGIKTLNNEELFQGSLWDSVTKHQITVSIMYLFKNLHKYPRLLGWRIRPCCTLSASDSADLRGVVSFGKFLFPSLI